MKTQFEEYRTRRQRTGAVALICLISAVGGFLFAEPGSAWVAAALRIGIVFGAPVAVLSDSHTPSGLGSF